MLPEAENVVDSLPYYYYLVALLPLMLVMGGAPGAMCTTVTNQYLVYRIHQLDTPQGSFGSKSSIFNLEAITPTQINDFFIRKCALFKMADLVQSKSELFLNKVLQESLVSGVLIIFDDESMSFHSEEMASLQAIERRLLSNATDLPIYLIKANDEINQLYEEYGKSKAAVVKASIYDVVVNNIFTDSHQLVVTSPQTSAINGATVTSFQAKLIGAGIEDQIPTYAIVAHYDSYSVVPGLSYGADSNASGLIILLELMRVFSKLYSNVKTKPKANLVFFVSGGGKLNYFGTKKWLHENLESSKAEQSYLFENLQFVVCLESLADSLDSKSLHMYVSKPPKSATPAALFWENLNNIAKSYYPSLNVSLVHKKINLADENLSWEHERFSLHRISAFTMSSLPTSKFFARRTISDVYEESYIHTLEINANILGETLARQLYGPLSESLLKSEFSISPTYIKSLFDYVAHIPRAQQLLLTTGKSYKLPPFLHSIKAMLKKYSSNQVQAYHSTVDSKNPEFILHDPVTTKMSIYSMKPALFDFFITILILLYLAVVYFIIKNFDIFTRFSLNSVEKWKVK